ncbi:hypothetical protein IE81DRAFT_180778 [Ceraceosorus guamensis]|uniref:Myb-like domain-containing protein n=1 Tax=Ceraceosorus guamensis TaxID=1522189 RepID=A0A316VVJ7_9BASI|nr:hypothetical protein IE81DRAFT_180778 [Ceraceosorus guamensis]PWN41314.1 hypothetical protein IE81DRAFT_180778 [Ceraceosorus guamensis]
MSTRSSRRTNPASTSQQAEQGTSLANRSSARAESVRSRASSSRNRADSVASSVSTVRPRSRRIQEGPTASKRQAEVKGVDGLKIEDEILLEEDERNFDGEGVEMDVQVVETPRPRGTRAPRPTNVVPSSFAQDAASSPSSVRGGVGPQIHVFGSSSVRSVEQGASRLSDGRLGPPSSQHEVVASPRTDGGAPATYALGRPRMSSEIPRAARHTSVGVMAAPDRIPRRRQVSALTSGAELQELMRSGRLSDSTSGPNTVSFLSDARGGDAFRRGSISTRKSSVGPRLRPSLMKSDGQVHEPSLAQRSNMLAGNAQGVLNFYAEVMRDGFTDESVAAMRRNWEPFQSYKMNKLMAEAQYPSHFIDERAMLLANDITDASSEFGEALRLANCATFVHYVYSIPADATPAALNQGYYPHRSLSELLDAGRIFLAWIVPPDTPYSDDILAMQVDLCTQVYFARRRADRQVQLSARKRAVDHRNEVFSPETIRKSLLRAAAYRQISPDDLALIVERFAVLADARKYQILQMDDEVESMAAHWSVTQTASDFARFIELALQAYRPVAPCSSSVEDLLETAQLENETGIDDSELQIERDLAGNGSMVVLDDVAEEDELESEVFEDEDEDGADLRGSVVRATGIAEESSTPTERQRWLREAAEAEKSTEIRDVSTILASTTPRQRRSWLRDAVAAESTPEPSNALSSAARQRILAEMALNEVSAMAADASPQPAREPLAERVAPPAATPHRPSALNARSIMAGLRSARRSVSIQPGAQQTPAPATVRLPPPRSGLRSQIAAVEVPQAEASSSSGRFHFDSQNRIRRTNEPAHEGLLANRRGQGERMERFDEDEDGDAFLQDQVGLKGKGKRKGRKRPEKTRATQGVDDADLGSAPAEKASGAASVATRRTRAQARALEEPVAAATAAGEDLGSMPPDDEMPDLDEVGRDQLPPDEGLNVHGADPEVLLDDRNADNVDLADVSAGASPLRRPIRRSGVPPIRPNVEQDFEHLDDLEQQNRQIAEDRKRKRKGYLHFRLLGTPSSAQEPLPETTSSDDDEIVEEPLPARGGRGAVLNPSKRPRNHMNREENERLGAASDVAETNVAKATRSKTRRSARSEQDSTSESPRQTRSRASTRSRRAAQTVNDENVPADNAEASEEEEEHEEMDELLEVRRPRASSVRYKPKKNAEIYKTGGNAKGRQLWSDEETRVLQSALRRFARRKIKNSHALVYRDVLLAHGKTGDRKLARWNNVQLKDKARNELLRMRREGEMIPYWRALLFPNLWEEKKVPNAEAPPDSEDESDDIEEDEDEDEEDEADTDQHESAEDATGAEEADEDVGEVENALS